ncbi:MAG: hypothetical protein FWG71_06755 [Synergistaceae bacterium]|nr:hypothetical protein [Synergistaceae bacterium]
MSEEAAIKHCLNCAHPFDATKWRQAKQEQEQGAQRRAQGIIRELRELEEEQHK